MDRLSKLRQLVEEWRRDSKELGVQNDPGKIWNKALQSCARQLDEALSDVDNLALAETLDAIADDTREHALNGEQHDHLRKAAAELRRTSS